MVRKGNAFDRASTYQRSFGYLDYAGAEPEPTKNRLIVWAAIVPDTRIGLAVLNRDADELFGPPLFVSRAPSGATPTFTLNA